MNGPSKVLAVALFSFLLTAASSCERQQPAGYVPGLGEIMTATQMRHCKLWFAGQTGNWPLAAYELDELKEGFDDAVRYHPTHKDVPIPISELLPQMTTTPLDELESAISTGDKASFLKAFDLLTSACNRCHQAANFGFNVVTRPTANPFTNQDFEPSHQTEAGQ